MTPVQAIKAATAEHFGVTVDELNSPTHLRRVAWPRQVAFVACKEYLDLSISEIGRQFGDRDHATVSHGIDAVRRRACPIETEAVKEIGQIGLYHHPVRCAVFKSSRAPQRPDIVFRGRPQ